MAHDPEPHPPGLRNTPTAIDAAEGGEVAAVFRHLGGRWASYFYRSRGGD